jgi:type IV pilus assembly protein PilV
MLSARPLPMAAAPVSSRGFTLLEFLVAILVLAVGLLGTVGLKVASIKHASNGNARASASVHAAEMLDRLRANPVRAAAGQYNIALGEAAPGTATTISQQDLQQWRRALTARFSGGDGAVTVTPAGDATIQIRWTERDNLTEQGRTMDFVFSARL